ncbi:MAG: two-component regulator propeller domain-containing protein [Spirochaetaceae bacterium]
MSNMRIFCFLAALILVVFPVIAPAQSVSPELAYFVHLGRGEGLSNASISAIVQDRYGFLWFGTQAGLNRYDGRSIEVFEHIPFEKNSLPHNLVQTLYEDPREPVLWVGTYDGVSRFDMRTREFTNYSAQQGSSSLSNAVVTSVVRDHDGMVWVGTLEGLNRLNPETGEIRRIGSTSEPSGPGELADQTVRSLHVDAENRLWIGTYGGLSVLDAERSELRTPIDSSRLGSPAVMDIMQSGPSSMWLAVWNTGLVRYDPDRDHLRAYELADTRAYTVAGADGRHVFAGTWGGGLFRLDTVTGAVDNFSRRGREDFGLSHDTVYSLAYDDAGALWIGTNGGGVNRFSERRTYRVRFTHDPEDEDSLSSGNVTAVTRDSTGTLWIGTYNGGLNRYDPSSERMIHYRAGADDPGRRISDDIITAVFEDESGTLWVGTNDGLNRYDRDAEEFETLRADPADPASIPADIIYAFEQEEPDLLWVGTYSAGVFLWDTSAGVVEHFPHDSADPTSLSDNLVYDIHKDSTGTVWVATNRGLNRFDRETRSWVRYLHDLEDRSTVSSNTCRELFETADGTLWVGTTGGGLNRYDRERDAFEHYTREDGLPSNTVVSMLENDDGCLWLGTSNGISVFDPARGHFRNLDEEDGIGGLGFSGGAMLDTDGSLWFGGGHGVTVLDGPIREPNAHRPVMHIVDVSVWGRSLSPPDVTFDGSRIHLSHLERSVGFEFVALDYASPEKNTYRYKLEGFDEEWNESGTRNYTNYTRLPGGRYTFLVEGANSDGVWSAEPASVELIVQSPPWRRWWAIAGYILLGLLILYIAVRLRERQVLARRVIELDSRRSELEKANRALGEISVKDGLTGLYNRRYFDLKLHDAFNVARRSGGRIALIMIDIDAFKTYNDLYGHPEGDECLKSLATTLAASVERSSDFVARYGGEEFSVLLTDTDCGGAARVAERIRRQVQLRGLSYPESPVIPVVTVSAGYCSLQPGKGYTAADLLRMADEALYTAKAAGRNTIASCRDCGDPDQSGMPEEPKS